MLKTSILSQRLVRKRIAMEVARVNLSNFLRCHTLKGETCEVYVWVYADGERGS